MHYVLDIVDHVGKENSLRVYVYTNGYSRFITRCTVQFTLVIYSNKYQVSQSTHSNRRLGSRSEHATGFQGTTIMLIT